MGEELEFTTHYDKNIAPIKINDISKWVNIPIKGLEESDEVDTKYVIDTSSLQKPIKVVFNNGGGILTTTDTAIESPIRKQNEKNAEKFMDRLIHDLLNKEYFDEDEFFSLLENYDVHLDMLSDDTFNDIRSILQDYKDQIKLNFVKCDSFKGLKLANALYALPSFIV